jgi:cell division protein FtsI/penicillin-binding protein 2
MHSFTLVNKKRLIYFTAVLITAVFCLFLFNAWPKTGFFSIKQFSKAETGLKRGAICDVTGNVLVMSQPAFTLLVEPGKIAGKVESIAELLSEELKVSPKDITRRLYPALGKKTQRVEVTISRKIDRATRDRILNRLDRVNKEGLRFVPDYIRHYPCGSLMAPLLGVISEDKGAGGIEQMMNDYLNPLLQNVFYRPAYLEKGATIRLTIDKQIQRNAETELKNIALAYKAESAVLVMANYKNGKILAMAQWPGFDPDRQYEDIYCLQNRAAIDGFAPGPLLDPLVMAAGLEQLGTEEDDAGEMTVKYDYFEKAIPTVITRLKPVDLYEGLLKFGFGKKTGIGLAEESTGLVRIPDRHDDFVKYPLAMRQLIFPTSLQILKAYCTLANKGQQLPLCVIESIGSTLTENDGTQNQTETRVIKPQIAEMILSGLPSEVINETKHEDSFQLLYKTAVTDDRYYIKSDSPVFTKSIAAIIRDNRFPAVIIIILHSGSNKPIPGQVFSGAIKNIMQGVAIIKPNEDIPNFSLTTDFSFPVFPSFHSSGITDKGVRKFLTDQHQPTSNPPAKPHKQLI